MTQGGYVALSRRRIPIETIEHALYLRLVCRKPSARKFKKRERYSCQEVADIVGVSRCAVWDWEQKYKEDGLWWLAKDRGVEDSLQFLLRYRNARESQLSRIRQETMELRIAQAIKEESIVSREETPRMNEEEKREFSALPGTSHCYLHDMRMRRIKGKYGHYFAHEIEGGKWCTGRVKQEN